MPPLRHDRQRMPFNSALGARIRETRNRRAMTQRALARQTSLRPDGLSKIEGGAYAPTVRSLWRIAQALSVPVDFLLPELDFSQEFDRLLYSFLREIWTLPQETRQVLAVLVGSLGTFVDGLNLPFDLKTRGSYGPSSH